MASNQTEETKKDFNERLMQFAPFIGGGLVAILLVAAGVWGYQYFDQQKEAKASEALFAYESQIMKLEKELYDKELEAMGEVEEAAAELPDIEKTPEVFEKNLADIAERYESAIQGLMGTRAATIATIQLADKYSEYGKDEKAKSLIDGLQGNAKGEVLSALAQLQQIAFEPADQCMASMKNIESILGNEELEFLWPEAYLRKAACSMQNNDMEAANKALEKLEADYTRSSAAEKSRYLKRMQALQSRDGA